MSRKMLHGVLRMPPDCWDDSELDRQQRHARYYHASEVIEGQDAAIVELESQRKTLQDLLSEMCSKVPGSEKDRRVIEALRFGQDEDYED